jgi:murein DD-endopeptidase MepM/ murein hydrolase activator NlpD
VRFPHIRRLGAWLASGLVGFFFLAFLRITGASLPGTGPQLPADPEPSALLTFTQTDTIHRGDTLSGLLLRNGMDFPDIEKVLRELRNHEYFSPRSLVPRQTVEFTKDENGVVRRIAFRVSPTEIYVFRTHPDSLATSYAEAVESRVKVRKLGGAVRSTFEEAIIAAGGNARLAGKFAEILSCDVDFFTEVRKGDRFGLLVEEQYVDGTFVQYGNILYGWYKGEEANANAVYYADGGSKGAYYDLQGKSLRRGFLKSPLNYSRISSYFSKARFHPILKKYRPHHGVDYAAPEGTPIVAVADGVVQFAGFKGGYGRYIEIKHDGAYATCYGHLCRTASGIRSGSHVKQGDKIGYVGHTGLATGSHLHYEVIEGGRSIDPLRMKNVPADPIPQGLLADFRRLAMDMAQVGDQLADGALVEPDSWKGMFAQNNVLSPSSAPGLH